MATVTGLFKNPEHPYTKGLLDSIPRLETERKSRLKIIKGMVPGLDEMPKGCRFENRCPYKMEICTTTPPPLIETKNQHLVSCYLFHN
jgi:oligopeptide/dipeptide ABC transporter ATP-binding protein